MSKGLGDAVGSGGSTTYALVAGTFPVFLKPTVKSSGCPATMVWTPELLLVSEPNPGVGLCTVAVLQAMDTALDAVGVAADACAQLVSPFETSDASTRGAVPWMSR